MGSSESTQNDMKNKEDSDSYAKAAKVAGAVAAGVGVLAGAVALLSIVGSEQPGAIADKKTMKAPGRQGTRMYRDDFTKDTKGYFHQLHRDDTNKRIK
ncbi:hypothetical protein I3760_06G144000 [Carya illinoinensis]|uniref:Uncharacterized protein n=1 Tax=Carya illinoinensis TaxID=32201 RepID=A0A922EVV9_CARIL|nr:hypothetical protein I3760_06G144000 [Carya illinoinensis]KAG6709632.1 hypothetical protein I3842_06G142400 [Carya illinoinensis]